MHKTIVYVPGVWDILHSGHINIIKRAKLCGEHLIVGVCSDRLVELHKKRPPAFVAIERAKVLSELKWVDEVHIYDNPDQTEALQLFNAGVFVVGEEFGRQGVSEHQNALSYCEEHLIPIVRVPRMPGISSTDLKAKVVQSEKTKVINDFWTFRGQQVKQKQVGLWQSTSLTKSEDVAKERKEKDSLYIQQALNRLPQKPTRVLELGCGTGRITLELAKLFDCVTAVDYVQDFLDVAQEYTRECKNIIFECKNVWEFEHDQYDCCVIAGLFPYLTDEQAEKLIQAIGDVHWLVLKESVGTFGRFELRDDHYSEELGSKYTAIYRSLTEFVERFAQIGHVLKYSEVVEQHRQESHLRVMLFERLQ